MSHKHSCCNGGNHVSVSKFKKLATVATAAVSVSVLLTACQGKKSASSTGTKTTKHSIALITDNNAIDDHSFNEAAWNGFKSFGKKHGLKQGKGGYQYFESSSAADFTPNANEAASSGFETIFGVGYQLTSAIKSAAKKNPKKNFVIIDDVISGQKNVASVTFESNQASYLAGIAAAYTTKTNHVGYIGGAKSATLELFEAGFKQGVEDGAKALGKKIKVDDQYIGNFNSTDKAKSIAQSMYASGADIIYHAAGNAGNGVFTEAKDINKNRKADKRVWVIGVDVDQSNLGSYTSKDGKKSNFVLTSVLKGLDVAVERIAEKAYQGKFPGGKHFVYTLEGNGVSVTKGNIDSKTWSKVQAARKQILNGKVKVAESVSDLK